MDLKVLFSTEKSNKFIVDSIYLKFVTNTDLKFINDLFLCQDVNKYFILSDKFKNNLSEFLSYLTSSMDNSQGFSFIIYSLDDTPIGIVVCDIILEKQKLVGNVSYAIHDNYRNKGYATEALQFICKITDESQFSALRLDIDGENIGSIRIAEKLNFNVNKNEALFDINTPKSKIRFAWYRDSYKVLPKRIELSLKAIDHFHEKEYLKAIELIKESLMYDNPLGSPHTDAQLNANIGMAFSSLKQYKEAYRYLIIAKNQGLNNDSLNNELIWLKTNASEFLF